jgi:transcriptional regulator with XRE-family HTH domain
METFGEALRRLRTERGISLRELARRASVDPGHLSRVEAGRRPPTPQMAAAVARALKAGSSLQDLARRSVRIRLQAGGWGRRDADELAAALVAEAPTADTALRLAHEWLVTDPPQVYELSAGRHVGIGTADAVRTRVHQLRLLDDHAGGTATHELAVRELSVTVDLLRDAAYSEAVGRALLSVLAELCQIAGWMTSDAGRPTEALRYYLTGVRAAHAAGDAGVAASNVSSLAYQESNVGDSRHAVLLAASAVRGAERTTSAAGRAIVAERLAWACARAGEPRGVDRALGEADEAYAGRVPADDPQWTYWLNEAEMAVMAGRCWTQLRRPLRAVPILEAATCGYGADRARESALYLSWLAEAYLQAGEVERAAEAALRALDLDRRAGSARSASRIGTLRRLFEPYAGSAAVAGFQEAVER